MKLKHFYTNFFALTLGLTMIFASACNRSPDRENMGELGRVELAFMSASDIHFGSVRRGHTPAIAEHYWSSAIRHSREVTGDRLHAVLMAGDFSIGRLQDYETLINLTAKYAGENVELIASYGNHEGDNRHYQYVEAFGLPIDNVRQVNGFTFICVGAHAGNRYTEEQAIWLDEQLAIATRNNNKPVFVLIHHPVVGGTLNPDATTYLLPVLERHRQAFVISGHDHDPYETLFKGRFISYENSYMEGDIRARFSVIRVTDRNKIVIQRFMLTPDTYPVHLHGMEGKNGDDIIIDYRQFLRDAERAVSVIGTM